ncbi:MAG: hypothetical protein IPJ84_18680 [Bdellovibrionales bacterium]|nr:hypothetical protein [Bdellovibrionales bacterium]
MVVRLLCGRYAALLLHESVGLASVAASDRRHFAVAKGKVPSAICHRSCQFLYAPQFVDRIPGYYADGEAAEYTIFSVRTDIRSDRG